MSIRVKVKTYELNCYNRNGCSSVHWFPESEGWDEGGDKHTDKRKCRRQHGQR